MCKAIDDPTTGNDTFGKLYGAAVVYYNYTGEAGRCFDLADNSDPYGLGMLLCPSLRNGAVLRAASAAISTSISRSNAARRREELRGEALIRKGAIRTAATAHFCGRSASVWSKRWSEKGWKSSPMKTRGDSVGELDLFQYS
ncbi:hypothetical protein LOK49_LG15G01553 [Camellia lanceoleosa]|uniref:Uncharacterized protein n=1 Tax=Camellia lanceoleosa TaxID=1840588 RepID=A0ACC0F4D3_9ERIC|nr:hypothetical protein LOK49_LG15G01553 [Camellia lanceoleosa]